MIVNITFILLAYLMGSIASAIIVCQAMGLADPRREGSGNPGATNVMRLHGRKAAILTLAGDVVKGIIPVLLAKALSGSTTVAALCGLAAFLGHLYPIFFKFEGGKGVATLVGVLFATHWMLGLAFALTWLSCAILFRYSSLSALIATLLTPLYSWLILQNIELLICLLLMGALLTWKHQSNIKNLIAGTEDKIGQKDTSS